LKDILKPENESGEIILKYWPENEKTKEVIDLMMYNIKI